MYLCVFGITLRAEDVGKSSGILGTRLSETPVTKEGNLRSSFVFKVSTVGRPQLSYSRHTFDARTKLRENDCTSNVQPGVLNKYSSSTKCICRLVYRRWFPCKRSGSCICTVMHTRNLFRSEVTSEQQTLSTLLRPRNNALFPRHPRVTRAVYRGKEAYSVQPGKRSLFLVFLVQNCDNTRRRLRIPRTSFFSDRS